MWCLDRYPWLKKCVLCDLIWLRISFWDHFNNRDLEARTWLAEEQTWFSVIKPCTSWLDMLCETLVKGFTTFPLQTLRVQRRYPEDGGDLRRRGATPQCYRSLGLRQPQHSSMLLQIRPHNHSCNCDNPQLDTGETFCFINWALLPVSM